MTPLQEQEVDKFRDLLRCASAKVPSEYYHLPVAGNKGTTVYRERVYCYELYHQLRTMWPEKWKNLMGEIDKNNHPILRGNDLKRSKPDFVVHVPGEMEGNLVVMEVKHVNAAKRDICKDLNHLAEFVQIASYKCAVYLVFGEENKRSTDFKDRACAYAASLGISLASIELWRHSKAGKEAIRVPWCDA